MSPATGDWPALQSAAGPPSTVPYRRAIWGKFRGSRDEFAWIGRSPSFDAGAVSIERHLALGKEDITSTAASFWRVLGDRCFALRIYPSPFVDAAGRGGLEWQAVEVPPCELPRVVLATAALKLAVDLAATSDVSSRMNPSGRAVTLEDGEMSLAGIVEQQFQSAVRALTAVVDRESLVRFYGAILAGCRPALLVAREPLAPDALAALLLPLDRATADRMSLAGWILSSTIDATTMSAAWDGIVFERVPAEFPQTIPDSSLSRASALASALVEYDAGRLAPQPLLDVSATPADPVAVAAARIAPARAATPVSPPSPTIQLLADYARSADRHRDLPSIRPAKVSTADRETLELALLELREQLHAMPVLDAHVDLLRARRAHLEYKLATIRKTAVALDPSLDGLDWQL